MLRKLSLALWSVLLLYSSSSTAKKFSGTQQEIHQICQTNYAQCLALLPNQLALSKEHSRVWYALKLYQLEALFALERFTQLRTELEPVIKKQNLPTKFKVHSFVLYAKLINTDGQETLASEYINEAKETLLAVSEDWPKPIEFVQIANLLNELKQYQEGYEMLLNVEERFASHNDPNYRYQLYTNMGHFALGLGEYLQHIDYRVKAMEWASKGVNLNQLAIATFNVARGHFFVENNDISRLYFEQTLPIARDAKNQSLLDKSHINIAEIYAREKRYDRVRSTLKHVKKDRLSRNYLDRFENLKKLTTKKPGDKPGKK